MLASPLLPAPTFSPQRSSDDSSHYRPSRDLEAFNSLLPPPIEFVEGSSSGALAVAEGKYEPINATPKPSNPRPERYDTPKTVISTPTRAAAVLPIPSSAHGAPQTSLYTTPIDLTWPATCSRGVGLFNNGNTCFLNSALQCLLHTPPLLRVLIAHNRDSCLMAKSFCMSCSLRQVAVQAHTSKAPFSPSAVANRLQTIAKHMRKGRQEDSHEFLRYAIDALQKSCLAGHSPKIDPKLAETTWVHKIFGGRLRSRVTCHDCGHNSDTFDRILDLSLDIFKSNSLKDALRKFVAIDYLKGEDKYKCEKCKKHVVAEKRFTLHEAPPVLTVHLKRFSPLGRKIGHYVDYDDHLSLQPYMSENQFGPSYSLYGVICHAGGGPNSGHYYAYIRSQDGRWWEMNDEIVTAISSAPTTKKTAYILFYIRRKGQELEAAVKSSIPQTPVSQPRNGLVAGMKKRREKDIEDDEAEDKGIKVSAPFIGPLIPPSPIINETLVSRESDSTDPQAAFIKSKIDAITQNARNTLASLANYDSDISEESDKKDEKLADNKDKEAMAERSDVSPREGSIRKSSPPLVPPSSSPVPATSFYGINTPSSKKRKSPDSDVENASNLRSRLPVGNRTDKYRIKQAVRNGQNPYNRMTYGKRHRRPTGI